jgi:hypothetical protein
MELFADLVSQVLQDILLLAFPLDVKEGGNWLHRVCKYRINPSSIKRVATFA